MNTEINLLEVKENKYIVPLFFGAIFFVGFLLVISLLLLQQSSLDNKISKGQSDIAEMELTLAEHNKAFATREKLDRIEIEVESIKEQTVPHVALYHHVVSLLPSAEQLVGYTLNDDMSFVVDAEFTTLDEVAGYVSKLLAEPSIIDAELTNVENTGSMYDTSLTVTIDRDILLVEGFGKND